MTNRKVAVPLVLLAIVVAVLGYSCFNYWGEPVAAYFKTNNPKLMQIRRDLNELKTNLREKGLYACCIQNECNWCALHMGSCPCAKLVMVEGNEKSCPECAAAWNKKQGRIPGVDPGAIKVTTYGVYGFENGGPHHLDSMKNETEQK